MIDYLIKISFIYLAKNFCKREIPVLIFLFTFYSRNVCKKRSLNAASENVPHDTSNSQSELSMSIESMEEDNCSLETCTEPTTTAPVVFNVTLPRQVSSETFENIINAH